jgi:hypothetical protein
MEIVMARIFITGSALRPRSFLLNKALSGVACSKPTRGGRNTEQAARSRISRWDLVIAADDLGRAMVDVTMLQGDAGGMVFENRDIRAMLASHDTAR